MSDSGESPVEKAEKTIQGIVSSFAAYFWTFVALAFPACIPLQPFPWLKRLRRGKLLAPPLLFLSISAFLFSIAIAIINSVQLITAGATWIALKAEANLDISVTKLLFTILPTFLWVLLVAWVGRLLLEHTHLRKHLFRYFCYIFGFFGASFFLWFLVTSVVLNMSLQSVPVRIFVSLTFLWYLVLLQPSVLSVVTIWRMTKREKGILKRTVKSALGLLLLAAMIVGSIFIQVLPRRLDETIAKSAERPAEKPAEEPPIKFANWPQKIHDVADIRFDGPDYLLIKFRIVAENPRDTTVFLERKMVLTLDGNINKPIELDVNESSQSTDPMMLSGKQSRILNYQGKLEKSQYHELAGRRVKFAIVATWYDLARGGLYGRTAWVEDDEDHNLDFWQLTEPTPTPKGNLKKGN